VFDAGGGEVNNTDRGFAWVLIDYESDNPKSIWQAKFRRKAKNSSDGEPYDITKRLYYQNVTNFR
jgi:hypothetical protein